MVESKELLDTALQLPEHERARIAERLITSLEPEEETSEEVELAWQEEIGKRAGQVDRGEVQCRPWEEVRDELKAKYHG
jgi:putative addiction module component (TIGR02574 family)